MKIDKEKLNNKLKVFANDAKNIAVDVTDKTKDTVLKTKEVALKSKDVVLEKMDVNGDGNIDIEDIIILGIKTPGVKISKDEFLRKELNKKYSEDVINKAIDTTLINAGIKQSDIDKIADEVIKYERNCVSGISAALGLSGGISMVATIPADIVQYYGYMLRTAQKLMYLYGFPEINLDDENKTLDTETINILTICLGVMYGVAGANNAVKAMANGLAKGVSKKIMSTALTKGTLYPMVKSICKWFGVNMTKKMLSGIAQKSIPVVGGIIGGSITYVSFKPCCEKLKKTLRDTSLSNPNHIETSEEKAIIEGILCNEC